MIIGVPVEKKLGEKRVAITPDQTAVLTGDGHSVLIEAGAGLGSGFADSTYSAAGAEIVPAAAELWGRSDLVVKVKEPLPEEFNYFRKGLSLFCFLHPAALPEMTKALLKTGVTAIDYDLLSLDNGRLPILEPMSAIAGKLAIQCGAQALQSNLGGRGMLLGGVPGVPPARVVVIGAGVSGSNAVLVAHGMGAEVRVLDSNVDKLTTLVNSGLRIRTVFSNPSAIARELEGADLVIGAVLIPGAKTPRLLNESLLSHLAHGAVLVDICIDQGGISTTSKPTTIADPVYESKGIVHYCVPNMPALVPRTSTLALTNAAFPWTRKLAHRGIQAALRDSDPLRRGLLSYGGDLTNTVVGTDLNLPALDDQAVRALLG